MFFFPQPIGEYVVRTVADSGPLSFGSLQSCDLALENIHDMPLLGNILSEAELSLFGEAQN